MKYDHWFYATWLRFAIRYRKTFLGPAWLALNPLMFTLVIGLLYSRIYKADAVEFVPHLAVGLIVWSTISTFVTGASTLFQRNRAQIFQGEVDLVDIVAVSVFSNFVQFLHQSVVILAVFLFYGLDVSWSTLWALVGLLFVMINGAFVSFYIGFLGARFHDLAEVLAAIMRIGFLATPVIWLPVQGGIGGVIGSFLAFNPFYYFIEIIRAPLLGKPFLVPTWGVVLGLTAVNCLLAFVFHRRFSRVLPIWI